MTVRSGCGSHRACTCKGQLGSGIGMEEGKGYTNVPTVTPAATEGIEPVLTYPNVPPPAVKAPRIYAGVSIPWL